MRHLNSLVKARKGKKLTQEQLAGAVGITRAYLANIERGRHVPSLKVAYRLAIRLGYSIEMLFFHQRDSPDPLKRSSKSCPILMSNCNESGSFE
ncbi:helix-turn-helix transcriptional regulator [Tumebacillus lipolyticus]|uniref:Helix-turn-helix transcriptional regulator n=1 Tax=Tumebacillus lipolyticus TaxID=1280370 RepID=A0ABW4ZRW9_9BACL